MYGRYNEHETNLNFYAKRLKSVGIDPGAVVSAEIPLERAALSGYGRRIVVLWLIGYARSRAGMYEHAQSA